MGVVIKRTGWLKNVNQVKSHVKYVGFRSREIQGDKGVFFNSNENSTDYKEFIKRVENNKAIKHPNAVKVHKIVFSLNQKDYEAYMRSGKDYKDLIRETLKHYEEKHGVKLDWIGNIHNSDGHPHAHIIIKAVSDNKDLSGKYKRIYYKKEDFKELREIFDKEFEREAEYRGFEKLDKLDFEKTINDIGKGFEAVIKDIKKDVKKEQYKAEHKKEREVRTKNKNNERER